MFSFFGSLFGLLKGVGLYFISRRANTADIYKEIIEDVDTAKRVKKSLNVKSASSIAKRLRKYQRD